MNTSNFDRDAIYEAANMLRSYCEHNDCKNGCWFADEFQRCRLGCTPYTWAEFYDGRWTEADVIMAKSLRMMGYDAIRTDRNVCDERYVVVKRIVNDVVYETAMLPKRSFANAKYGKTYMLEDIIREAGEDNTND